jgi:hypothetical protein
MAAGERVGDVSAMPKMGFQRDEGRGDKERQRKDWY